MSDRPDLPTLERYRVLSRLDEGGMAEVFLAEATGAGGFARRCVIKRVRYELAKSQRHVELFLREARLSARLSHPNCVHVHELIEEEGHYLLVMEHVDGLSLRRLAKRHWAHGRPLPLEPVLRAVADAALGLHHAHTLTDDDGQPAGLVHRDISPDNLMLTREGVAKVLDFGIAKSGEVGEELTQTDELRGKVPYLAPEQIQGEPLDGRCDLWALGVCLYWLVCGRRPFEGKNAVHTLDVILRQPPPRPSELNPSLPRSVELVLLALLQKDPDRRLQSGLELGERLLALDGVPSSPSVMARFAGEALSLEAKESDRYKQPAPPFDAAVPTVSGVEREERPEPRRADRPAPNGGGSSRPPSGVEDATRTLAPLDPGPAPEPAAGRGRETDAAPGGALEGGGANPGVRPAAPDGETPAGASAGPGTAPARSAVRRAAPGASRGRRGAIRTRGEGPEPLAEDRRELERGPGPDPIYAELRRRKLELAPIARSLATDAVPLPEVPLPAWEGLEVRVTAPPPPSAEDLLRRLDELLFARADRRRREPGEPITLGDEVELDVLAYARGRLVPFSARRLRQELAPWPALPGLAEALVGLEVGEGGTFRTELGPDYPAPALRGIPVRFLVDVRRAWEVSPLDPEDPEHLASLSRGSTLPEVMERLAQEIDEERGQELLADAREAVLDALSAQVALPVPGALVDEEIVRWWGAAEGQLLVHKGFTDDEMEDALGGWLEDPSTRGEALRRIKVSLALKAIIEAEGLEVTQQDARRFVKEIFEEVMLSPAKVKAVLKDDKKVAERAIVLALHTKAVELVMARARITVVD